MILQLTPQDTLFFRDGKPFTMGEDNWGQSNFPPLPSTLYGALRSWYARHQNIKLSEIEEATKDIQIQRLAYIINGQVCYPLPNDIVGIKHKSQDEEKEEKEAKQYRCVQLILSKAGLSSVAHQELLTHSEGVEGVANGMIRQKDLKKYLNGTCHELHAYKLSDWIQTEMKVGIQISRKTGMVKEGHLYKMGLQRPKQFSFLLDVQFPNNDFAIPQNDFMHLGGERKLVFVQKYTGPPLVKSHALDEHDTRFKLHLYSPVFLGEGQPLLPELEGKIELLTTALGKSFRQGGFDMKQRKPKTTSTYLPAGSVFYYKFTVPPSSETLSYLSQLSSVSDIQKKEGLGLCFIAKVDTP
ncbi:MAG: type III-B CRISPR module-associated protein Cmr3 [Flammeovirgaceae bacterium]